MLISKKYNQKKYSYIKLTKNQETTRQIIIKKIKLGQYIEVLRECQICGNNDFEVLSERDRYSLPVKTVICKNCTFIYTNPILRSTDYQDFYEKHYTELYEGFLYSPEIFFMNQMAAGKRLHNIIKTEISLSEESIGEVGCAAGGILNYLSKYCKNVAGVDYGTKFMQYGVSRGLNLKVGNISDMRDFKPSILIYSHVLEHIEDIKAELKAIWDILPEEGKLIIDVPGIYNLKKIYNNDFLKSLQNAHLYYFSSETLVNLMSKNHFETLYIDENCVGIFKKSKKIIYIDKIKKTDKNHNEIIELLRKNDRLSIYYKFINSPKKIFISFLIYFGLYSNIKKILFTTKQDKSI